MSTIPESIGPYHVLRPIARGGMAEVFEVQDPISGERYALKLLMEMKSSVRRFNREFEALTRLNHSGIVRVFRYGFHQNHPWITMELLEGVPLQSRVKSFGPPGEPRRTDEVIRICYHLANALQYVHDRGLVHRDLKSANVLVLPDGRVKLFDFGTAHLVDPLEAITQEGDFVGTFSYAAPEQIVGAKVDFRADTYAMGVLLYRLSTGRRPFKSNDPRQLAHMHLNVEAKPALSVVPSLPPELDALIRWMMQKRKKDRPQRVDEVADALERIAGKPLSMPGMGIVLRDGLSLGRDDEHRALWRHLGRYRRGSSVVVMGGDAQERGRFAAQVVSDGARRDWLVARADAARGGLPGLGRALRTLVGEPHADETEDVEDVRAVLERLPAMPVAALPRAISGVLPGVRSIVEQQSGFAALLMEEVTSWTPAALSALEELVSVFARSRRGVPLIVTGPTHGGSEAYRLIERVAPQNKRLLLSPLDLAGTAFAVGRLMLRRPPPLPVARRIHRASSGYPSLIEAVVRDMVAAGELTVKGADGNRVNWQPSGDAAQRPAMARQRAEQRLSELPATGRRVFEVLHIAGAGVPGEEVAQGMEWSFDEAEVLLSDLVDDLWVRWEGGPRDEVVALDPLLLEHVGEQMEPARRALVQRLLLPSLLERPPSGALVDALIAVNRPLEALRAALAASARLADASGTSEALELLERVRPLAADEHRIDPGLRTRFLLQYSRCIQQLRPMDPASLRALDDALELSDDERQLARGEFGHAELHEAIGHYANYRKYLLRAWGLLETTPEPGLTSEVARHLGLSHYRAGQLAQAGAWFDRASVAAEESGLVDHQLAVAMEQAALAFAHGQLGRSREGYEAVIARAESEGRRVALRRALAGWAHVLRAQGSFSVALTRVAAHLPTARLGEDTETTVALLLALAWSELDLYRLGFAQERVDELTALVGRGERLHLRLETQLIQGRIQLASGNPSQAAYVLSELVLQAERAEQVILAERARAMLAEAKHALGDTAAAKRGFQKALITLMGSGHKLALAEACVAKGRATPDADDPTKAFRLVSKLLGDKEFRVLRIEHRLAELRFARSQDDAALSRLRARDAAIELNELAAELDRIEQAALRVHPWTREVKRGVGRS